MGHNVELLGELLYFKLKFLQLEYRWGYWKYSLTAFSSRTVVPGSTQTLTQMSARDVSCRIKATVRKTDNITVSMCPCPRNTGSLKLLER